MQGLAAQARFAFLNIFQLGAAASFLYGGAALWIAPGLILTFLLFDEMFTDRSVPEVAHPWFLNALLFATLPCLAVLAVSFLYYFGGTDPLGLETAARQLFGRDLAQARLEAGALELLFAGLAVAVFFGAAGINVAHELVHRTDKPVDRTLGRWLLAFCFDTTFAIEHVYGHHRNVGTPQDPATARRGETVLGFAPRSAVGGFINAFNIESMRLKQKGKVRFGWRNMAVRGQLMTAACLLASYGLAGWSGVAVFTVLGLHGKAFFEGVNYIEHYGLVRVPGQPVEARHSWDCHNAFSSAFLCNLTRHSDHHMNARKPFWQQKTHDGAPVMPHGYATMLLIALVPPLWRRMTAPILAEWDLHRATEGELRALRRA